MPAVQSSIDAVRIAAAAADRIKADNIVAFDVSDLLAITEIMLIASASNERQVLAIADEVEKDLYLKAHLSPRSREGMTEARWILLDYGDFVVHIMHQEARDFYNLERLWRDRPTIDLKLVQQAVSADVQETDESDKSLESQEPVPVDERMENK